MSSIRADLNNEILLIDFEIFIHFSKIMIFDASTYLFLYKVNLAPYYNLKFRLNLFKTT